MENVIVYTSFCANVFIIVGGIIAIVQLFEHRKDEKEELDRRRKERTILYIETILPVVSNTVSSITTVIGDKSLVDESKLKPKIRNALKSFLRSMERLSVGINTGIYDIEVVNRIIGTGILKTWYRYSVIVQHKRESQDNPRLYVEYEELAQRIRAMQEGEKE